VADVLLCRRASIPPASLQAAFPRLVFVIALITDLFYHKSVGCQQLTCFHLRILFVLSVEKKHDSVILVSGFIAEGCQS
jgi:hypothetical protein